MQHFDAHFICLSVNFAKRACHFAICSIKIVGLQSLHVGQAKWFTTENTNCKKQLRPVIHDAVVCRPPKRGQLIHDRLIRITTMRSCQTDTYTPGLVGQASTAHTRCTNCSTPSPGPAPSCLLWPTTKFGWHTKTLERDLEIALICQRQQRQIYNKGRCRYGRRRAVFLRQFDVWNMMDLPYSDDCDGVAPHPSLSSRWRRRRLATRHVSAVTTASHVFRHKNTPPTIIASPYCRIRLAAVCDVAAVYERMP